MLNAHDELEGSIKRLMYDKYYGFINGDDGVEYFFHAYEVSRGTKGFDVLTIGDRVKFFPQENNYKTSKNEDKQGFKAIRVRPV